MNNSPHLEKYNTARIQLAADRKQADATESGIISEIGKDRREFIDGHVLPAMTRIMEKLCDIQEEQLGSHLLEGRMVRMPARMVNASAELPARQESGRKLQSYGYICFETKADGLQHAFHIAFDRVDGIDLNFPPQLMAEGVDTVKFFCSLDGTKSDRYELLGEARTDNPEKLAEALHVVETRAIEATYIDSETFAAPVVSLRAAREALHHRAARAAPAR